MRIIIIGGVLFLSFCITAKAQQAITSTGGDALGDGGTVAYSIGQVVYTTNTDPSGSVSQGVQQAYEIYSVGMAETELNISLLVFPNPATDDLTLQIRDFNNENLSYQLFDLQGKLISNGQVTAQQTQISITGLQSSVYLIHIVNKENQIIQSFKIIKN